MTDATIHLLVILIDTAFCAFCAFFCLFRDIVNNSTSVEFLIASEFIEVEDNVMGLRLQRGAVVERVSVRIQTAVMNCMFWKDEMEMWWNHGCTVGAFIQVWLLPRAHLTHVVHI